MRIRTGYSFRNAVGPIGEVMARLKEIGYEAAPISDRQSTFGFVRWKKLAEKNGLVPIFGVELGVTDSLQAKRPTMDHWTFFATGEMDTINNLVGEATKQFHYEALLTYEQANAANCVKIVGHRSDLSLVENDGQTYVALSPSASRGYLREAIERGFPLIASSDNRYPTEEDIPLFEIVCGASTQTYPQHILSWEEWEASVEGKVDDPAHVSAAKNTALSLMKREGWASLRKGKLLAPERPATLRAMCEEGAKKLDIDLTDPVYGQRLDRELKLIAEKQFEDYFYIIADVVNWARDKMIVGPARGSSCGSLACYLLGITTIDPIPYNLIFERFIDVNRNDLPDIDIDFSDQKRQMVFDYMAAKYGSDHVARLGTVAMYQPKSAVAEAGAALGIPRWKCDAMLESLVERSSGDSRAMNTLEDTLTGTQAGQALAKDHPEIWITTKMEGHPRHHSQHAAGIVLTDQPVSRFIAVDMRTGATHCDKKDAEELDFLKIDALGLTQLSIFEDALDLAGLPMNHLETLKMGRGPQYYDPKTAEVLNKSQYSGIFQFMGQALQDLTGQVEVDRFDDLVSITALARPGPLSSGGAQSWVRRKSGAEPVSFPHPVFEPYMADTNGIIMYQEQVMEIGRNIGGLSWEDVTALRKAMSKSLGKEYFDQFGDHFKAGAIEKGVPPELTEKIWDDMCAYGAWAFNKSHSVAYGVVSYWCCWLKTYYPVEFAAATLSHLDDPDKQIQLLRELDAEGIKYIPVDAEISTDKWSVGFRDGAKVLVGPVTNVIGLGPKMAQDVASARARGEPLPARVQKLLANPKTKLDSLWPIRDGFQRIMPDPAERNIFTPQTYVSTIEVDGTFQELLVFVTIDKLAPKDENGVIEVTKRGGKRLTGPDKSLNMWVKDDTGTIFAKINRYDMERIGRDVLERGKVGKALYAIKGRVPPDFKMIQVKQIRYIGDLDGKVEETVEQSLLKEEQ